jgi:DNA processing protein
MSEMADTEQNVRIWLTIQRAFGATNIKKWNYIDIDKPVESVERLLSNNTLQNDAYIRALKSVSSLQIDATIDICERHGISIYTPDSEDYPEHFRRIANPPAVLFVLGSLAAIKDMPAAAIVGARDCCEYSGRVAAYFAEELAKNGVNIVSGFARGVDSAAHTAALSVGGVTTAVLGSGILYDYPRGTMSVKREIARHGAVISEYLPTSNPAGENFKVRNRLITGLSDCVIVAEAGARSGSLNSANHAAEQGKELFVVPPRDIFDPSFRGQLGLLRDGANLALSAEDVLNFLIETYEG